MEIQYMWEHKLNNATINFWKVYDKDYKGIDYIAILDVNDHSTLTEDLKDLYPARFYFRQDEDGLYPYKPSDRPDVYDFNSKVEENNFAELENAKEGLDKLIRGYMNNPLAEMHGMHSGIGMVRGFFNEYLSYKISIKDRVEFMLGIATNGTYNKLN